MHDNVRTLAQLIGRILAERWYRFQQGSADRASGRSVGAQPIKAIAEESGRAYPPRAGR